MTTANRPNRKASDAAIIRLNSVGLSLATISKQLDVHPTTITTRLKNLKVPPADTRRAFMEDIIRQMPADQVDWLADQLGPHISIKDFVLSLITHRYIQDKNRFTNTERNAA